MDETKEKIIEIMPCTDEEYDIICNLVEVKLPKFTSYANDSTIVVYPKAFIAYLEHM